MSQDPKIEAALAEARMRAEMARSKYPVLNPEQPQGDGRPPQPPGTPPPPPMANPHTPAPVVSHVTPAPSVPPGGLQTASFDALIREVDRRKTAALESLQEQNISVEDLERELALRQLPMEAVEVLRELPTSVLKEEITRLKKDQF